MVKKILIIVGSIILAVLIFLGVAFLTAPDRQIGNEEYTATYKGNGKEAVTIKVKGTLPDGYYWHVNGGNADVLKVELKKNNEKCIKIKVRGQGAGQTLYSIYASNELPDQVIEYVQIESDDSTFAESGETTIEDADPNAAKEPAQTQEERKEVDNGGLKEEEPETLGPVFSTFLSINGEILVSEDKKVHMSGFAMDQTNIPKLLIEGMPYPIYYVVYEGSVYFSIPNADDGWRAHGYDESIITAVGPFYGEDGLVEFSATPNAIGSTMFKLSNYMLNSGVQMTISYKPLTQEITDEKTGEVEKSVTANFISITDIAMQEGKIVSAETEKQYQRIKEIIGEVIVPEEGEIKEFETISIPEGDVFVDPSEEAFEEGDDVIVMKYMLNNVEFTCEIMKTEDGKRLIQEKSKIAKYKYLEGSFTIENKELGNITATALVVPNDPSVTIDTLTENTKGTYIAYWEVGSSSESIFAEDVTWMDVASFIAQLKKQ